MMTIGCDDDDYASCINVRGTCSVGTADTHFLLHGGWERPRNALLQCTD